MSDVDGKTTTPTNAAVKAKQDKAGLEVTVDVVLKTGAFDVTKPHLIEQAEAAFREQVAAVYGDVALSDVRLIKVNHHVGADATYVYTATLKG